MTRNWHRGLFRLWLVASVLWVVGILGYMMHSGIQNTENWIQAFCFDQSRPPREGHHECFRRGHTYAGRELHRFEQSVPPTSPLELATWERTRRELNEGMANAMANKDTPFWNSLRWNWFILPLGPVLLLVIGAIVAKVVAWIGSGFMKSEN